MDRDSVNQPYLITLWNRIWRAGWCFSTRPKNKPDRSEEADTNRQTSFRQLGKGQCGTVWQIPGTGQVVKLMNDGKKEQLWNDCCVHKKIEEAFQNADSDLQNDINLPRFGTWVQPSDTAFWNAYRIGSPVYGLISDQILPVPEAFCEELIDRLAPHHIQREKRMFLLQQQNQDCLIRIYLGRRNERYDTAPFRLRNFDLMVHEMEALALDTKLYARILARTLAFLHWKVGVDANDIEFVIGCAPRLIHKLNLTADELLAAGPDHAVFASRQADTDQSTLAVWVLDFNQCQSFPETEEGVVQLMKAFYFNDPYYPRPVSRDPKDLVLWDTFKIAYLDMSVTLTETPLPKWFIRAVEHEGKRRSAQKSIFT